MVPDWRVASNKWMFAASAREFYPLILLRQGYEGHGGRGSTQMDDGVFFKNPKTSSLCSRLVLVIENIQFSSTITNDDYENDSLDATADLGTLVCRQALRRLKPPLLVPFA